MSQLSKYCTKCGWIHCGTDVIPVGRFNKRPTGYVIREDHATVAVLYPTSEEAEAALCERRAAS